MVDLTQAHKASIELLGTRHTALVEAVRNYVNGSVQPSIDELIAAIEDVTTDIDTKEKMLLGLASRQAKKPVPSLILDFKTRHYLQGTRRPEKGYGIHDLLTVERATPKWVYNASGKLVEVPAHEPAYQHDPVTGEPQGLLIEESRTNLLPWSEDLSQSYNKNGNVTVSEVSGAAPDGGSAHQVIGASGGAGSDSAGSDNFRFFGTVPGGVLTLSFWIWSNSATSVAVRRRAPETGLDNTDTVQISPGFNRVSFTDDYEVASQGRFILGNADGDFFFWGAQLEEGSTPSSYIPTEDAPVTRAADDVYRELGEEFNPMEGTVFVEVDVAKARQSSGGFATSILSFGEPGRNCTFALYTSASNRRAVQFRLYGPVDTETVNAEGEHSDVTTGTVKIAASYSVSTGSVFLSVLGQSFSRQWAFDSYYSDTPELLMNRLGRSQESTYSSPSQEFLDVRYIPRALSEAELNDLTS